MKSGYKSGYLTKEDIRKTPLYRRFLVVEPRGVEPLSEKLRAKLSTGLAESMKFPLMQPLSAGAPSGSPEGFHSRSGLRANEVPA